ncbi:hypothetical protein PAMA_008857 [Pampus argenteus]
MATDAGFYVTLPSNASKDVFKNNTSSNYTVDLAKAIELNEEWESGRGGYFERPRDLLEQIIPKLKNYDPAAEAVYNNVTKRIDFKGSGQYKIRAQAPLAYMLGLKPDIIQYQPIGDSYSPLLSVVNVRGGFENVRPSTEQSCKWNGGCVKMEYEMEEREPERDPGTSRKKRNASYVVAQEIAKRSKPFGDGESVLRIATPEMDPDIRGIVANRKQHHRAH